MFFVHHICHCQTDPDQIEIDQTYHLVSGEIWFESITDISKSNGNASNDFNAI